jgi:hypothetical protein
MVILASYAVRKGRGLDPNMKAEKIAWFSSCIFLLRPLHVWTWALPPSFYLRPYFVRNTETRTSTFTLSSLPKLTRRVFCMWAENGRVLKIAQNRYIVYIGLFSFCEIIINFRCFFNKKTQFFAKM